MIFKTTLKDINAVAVAIDKLGKITSANMSKNTIEYTLYGKAIEGLSAKQLALALSTQKLTPLQIEQIIEENKLIKTYGAEVLIKEGLIATNSRLLASEKAVSAKILSQSILQSTLNKETAKEFIQKNLIVAANGEEAASTILLNKALMDEAVERGILSEEKAAEILSTYGVVTADTAEIASKKSLTTVIIEQTKAKIAATAAAHPLAVGIIAIIAATYGAIKASEAWTNRLKKQAQESSNAYKDTLEEIESLNSELQSNGQRIDELNAKENLTLVESEELEKLKESNRELENTLALKEKIAQQENAKANKDSVKYFNEDTNTYNNETGKYSSTHIEVATQYLDEIYAKEQRIHELELEMSRTDDNTEKYRELSGELDMTQKSFEDLLQRVQDYYDTFTDLDDNLFEGQDDELIQQLETFYRYMNEILYGVAETNTNTIRDTLAKADFQSASKQLEELGKSGELSVATLSSRFPELIEYLKKAGISAQELYHYIMALTNPDAVNYEEVERQFRESLGIRDGEINGASDQKIWDEIKDSFSEDEWQIALEAYLKVRDQYGEHPEGWTTKDWVANIQSELETEELEVNVTFDQAWADSFTSENDAVKGLGNTLLDLAEKGRLTTETFNNADSTGYFKNLGISADEAVSKINKLVDEASQLSSMSSQISSMSEALSTKIEDGFVSADTLSGFDVEVRGLDSWDRFQEVLGSTTSSYEECQEAANALATEWVNSSDFLAQLTEQNEEYYKTQLESMGIENYEELISYAHALNEVKEALSQSSLELGNATYDEIEALIEEGVYSELAANMILALYDAKIAEQAATLDTAADCENLIALAGDADRTSQSIQLLIQLMNIYSGLESGVYAKNDFARTTGLAKVTAIKAQLEALANGEVKDMEIEPTVKLGSKGKSSAKSAGKDAGKSFEDGLKEELSDIEGVISGITGRIDKQITTIKSQKEAALESIDAQIDALNEQKSALEAQKKALEEERDARIEIIEQQKKQLELAIKSIDKQIKAKEKIISGIQDEIKAMQDANEQRKLQISLQKEQYALERLQHQRTILIYSEEKGMHYVTDTKGIRDQKQKVDDAKLEIEIANKQKQIDLIEKEIDLLNKKKDAINEQIDLLDEQIDQINEFYDAQIKAIDAQIESIDKQIEALQKQKEETEKYYELLIENLEKSKSKYEELTELVKQAELSAALKQLGIDEEALLAGSEEEFEKLKTAYLDIVYQLNAGNDDVLNALRELSGYEGTAPAVLSDSNTELDEMNGKLDESNTSVGNVNTSLGETASTTSEVATNVGDITTNLTEANTLVSEEQTAFSNLRQTIDQVIEAINQKTQAIEAEQNAVATATGSEMSNFELLKNKILEVKETLDTVNDTVATMDRQPIDNLTSAFQLLHNQLILVSNVLAVEAENSIASSIQALNNISLEEGIIAQFTNLKTAIDSVTSAISGGGGESSGGEGQGGSGSKQGGESGGKSSKGESSGGNSLTGAITEMGNTAKEIIGEPDAEGDGTVIGEFSSMETAVNDVTTAIGSTGSESGEESGGEEDGSLIGSIVDLGETTEETLGEPDGDGVIGRFGEFKSVIEEAANQVRSISEGLDEIDGKEVECTITINVKMNGPIPAFASGTVLGNMQIESATYNAKYGKAFASGTIGLPHAEKNALVSEYGQTEMTVLPDGRTIVTDTPTMMDLPKDTVIYNEEETKKIMDNKIDVSGKAYSNGSADNSTIVTPDGKILRPLQPGDKGYDLMKAFEPLVQKMLNGEEDIISNAVFEGQKQMEKWTKEITNNTAINNVVNNRNVQQPVTVQIGDINLTGVQDVNGLAQAIKTRLPNAMLQEIHRR